MSPRFLPALKNMRLEGGTFTLNKVLPRFSVVVKFKTQPLAAVTHSTVRPGAGTTRPGVLAITVSHLSELGDSGLGIFKGKCRGVS